MTLYNNPEVNGRQKNCTFQNFENDPITYSSNQKITRNSTTNNIVAANSNEMPIEQCESSVPKYNQPANAQNTEHCECDEVNSQHPKSNCHNSDIASSAISEQGHQQSCSSTPEQITAETVAPPLVEKAAGNAPSFSDKVKQTNSYKEYRR